MKIDKKCLEAMLLRYMPKDRAVLYAETLAKCENCGSLNDCRNGYRDAGCTDWILRNGGSDEQVCKET